MFAAREAFEVGSLSSVVYDTCAVESPLNAAEDIPSSAASQAAPLMDFFRNQVEQHLRELTRYQISMWSCPSYLHKYISILDTTIGSKILTSNIRTTYDEIRLNAIEQFGCKILNPILNRINPG
jgi:hypothetical protein